MRLFVAIELPESWRAAARAARITLEREVDAPLRWVDPALMHLTLRFLGEVDEQRLHPLQSALDESVPAFDVELRLADAGTFGSPARAPAAWLGVGGDVHGLEALAQRVEEAVAAAGFAPERRAFRAHITLARLGRQATRAQRRAVAEAVAGLPAPPPEPFRATSIALVRSHLGRGGPRYEALSRHPPGAAAGGR